MTVTDPIADMMTRIRNSLVAKHEKVSIPHSNTKLRIAEILKEQGFISKCSVRGEGVSQQIDIALSYDENGNSIIRRIERKSKPGRRVYLKKFQIPKILNGYGVCLISTSKGIVDGKTARLQNTGGEFIGVVY